MKIYSNFTNYIHEIKSSHELIKMKKKLYLIFNPSVHNYTVVDEFGADIFQTLIQNNDTGLTKEIMLSEYDLSSAKYDDMVEPFISHLLKLKLLTETKTDEIAKWILKEYNNYDAEKYHFDNMYISISETCNLNCIYCFNKDRRKHRGREKLSISEITQLVKDYAEIGGKRVTLTGGEPTMEPDFLSLCKRIRETGVLLDVITNGTLLNNFSIEEIVDSLDSLNISLDSVDNDVQQCLWDNKNYSVSKDIISFLDNLNAYCKEHNRIFKLGIMPVVTKYNYKFINDMINTVCEHTDFLKITWIMTQYETIGNDIIDKDLKISQFEFDSALWNGFGEMIPYTELMNLILSKGGKDNLADEPHLVMCEPSFFVTRSGDVYPCQGLEQDKYMLGSIKNTALKEIFTSHNFTELNRSLHIKDNSMCGECEFRACCNNKYAKPCCKVSCKNCKEEIVFRLYMKARGINHRDEYEIVIN